MRIYLANLSWVNLPHLWFSFIFMLEYLIVDKRLLGLHSLHTGRIICFKRLDISGFWKNYIPAFVNQWSRTLPNKRIKLLGWFNKTNRNGCFLWAFVWRCGVCTSYCNSIWFGGQTLIFGTLLAFAIFWSSSRRARSLKGTRLSLDVTFADCGPVHYNLQFLYCALLEKKRCNYANDGGNN